MSVFWDHLNKACEKIGKKPSKMASEIGLSSSAMFNYKNGRIPTGEVLIKLSKQLRCSTDYLLGNTNYPENTISIGLKVLMIFQSVIKNYLNSFDLNFATNLDEEECVEYVRFYKKVVATEKIFSAYVSDSNKECDTIDIKVFEIAEIIEVVSKAINEMDKYEVGNLNILDQKEEFQ